MVKKWVGQKMGWSKNGLVKKWVGQKMGWSKNELVKKWVGQKMGWSKNGLWAASSREFPVESEQLPSSFDQPIF
nr:hypothetical protein [Rhodopirellula sp. SM50]